MKKFFNLAIVCICAFSLSAQNLDAEQKKDKKEKVPVITFENTVYDYGEIYRDGDGTCEFVFTNTGKADLILTNVRSTCGCTVPEWPKDPIPPKKSAVIKVLYHTNRVGPINRSITVESNAENNRVLLNIKGNVIEKPSEQTPENSKTSLSVPN